MTMSVDETSGAIKGLQEASTSTDHMECEYSMDRADEIEHKVRYSVVWSDAATKLFLDIYKVSIKLFEMRRLKHKHNLWSHIAKEMGTKGFTVTPLQVENKFKTLERSYKNVVCGKKKYVRSRSKYTLESELKELFGHKRKVTPITTYSRSGIPNRPHMGNKLPQTAPSPQRSNPLGQSSHQVNQSKSEKIRDSKIAEALQSVKRTVVNLTVKMDEQLENQKKFLDSQVAFQKNLLSVQREIHSERKRKNDLLETLLKTE